MGGRRRDKTKQVKGEEHKPIPMTTWLQRQVLNYPVHWITSIATFLVIVGFCQQIIGINIFQSTQVAYIWILHAATIAEYNQYVIKKEHEFTFIDVLDGLLDWGSWVFFPSILTGGLLF